MFPDEIAQSLNECIDIYRLFLNFCFPGKSQKLLHQRGASFGCLSDGIDTLPDLVPGDIRPDNRSVALDNVEKIV